MKCTKKELDRIGFHDLFDLNEIQRIQDLFSDATGVASIITHPDGLPITKPSNFCRFCNDIIRKTEKGLANCYCSDAAIGKQNLNGPICQRCLSGGLWDAGASISVGGKHIANWLIGQVKTEHTDEQEMLLYAQEIGADVVEFKKALDEVVVMSADRFKKIADTLYFFANELSQKAYNNLVQNHLIEESQKKEALLLMAKENAEASQAKFKSYIDNAPDGVFIADQKGTFLEANRAGFRMTGYTLPELQERTLSDLILDPDMEKAKHQFRTLIKTGSASLVTGYATKSGEKRFWSIEAVKLSDTRFLGFAKDITERKRAETELVKLSAAVKQSPSVIAITDTNGTLQYVNPMFTESTGYSFEEAVGQNPHVLKSGVQSDEVYRELWQTISSGNVWRGEFHNRKKNGELYWEMASVSPIFNEQGQIINYVKVAENITEKKKTEQELIQAKEKAEQSDRLKSAFLANMSHEIRTPMNGILGFAELLSNPDLTGEEQREYIKIIEKSGQRMLNIINDIVDISKIEAGLMRTDWNETNVNELMEYTHKFFKPETDARSLKLSVQTPLSAQEATVVTDREKLYAILTNLVKNAIKYTKKGSIAFGYDLHREQEPPALVFYVKDTGIGVRKDRQEAIFERFIQADIDDTMAYQGTGLGLAITKAYVEMLGGKIWLESDPDGLSGRKGSTFYFTLPYKNDE